MGKWWLSLIKVCSLTMGIISFLLVWLFYIDHQLLKDSRLGFIESCSTGNMLILAAIFLTTIVIYFLIMKSQMTFRYKEFFVRRYYGESGWGIVLILLFETIVFIAFSFVLSLVLIDQVAPLFNLLTDKNVNTRHMSADSGFLVVLCFLVLLGFAVGIFPAIFCAGKRAVDLLKKLPE
jgi:hypothetical protein